jgi:hypothetical protein
VTDFETYDALSNIYHYENEDADAKGQRNADQASDAGAEGAPTEPHQNADDKIRIGGDGERQRKFH